MAAPNSPSALEPALPPRPEDEPPFYGLDPEMEPNLDELVTEDGAPVDSIFTEKQQRLATECLYSSWEGPGDGRPVLVMSNVGFFHTSNKPPLVPDVLLSLDVTPAGGLHTKAARSYFLWLAGKPPDVVIEIVSDKRGEEEGNKRRDYARWGVLFYVIFDPRDILQGGLLRAYVLQRRRYEPIDPGWFPEVGLGLRLWEGTFEGQHETWLRWCYQNGQVIPTGAERAEQERRLAEEARLQRDQAQSQRDEAKEKARRLAAQLRALGIEPEA